MSNELSDTWRRSYGKKSEYFVNMILAAAVKQDALSFQAHECRTSRSSFNRA
jgi:hypothetical protein